MASPLKQFEIQTIVPIHIGGTDLSFTNSSLWMIIATGVATAFFTLSMRNHTLIPSRWQTLAELSYEFISNMIRDNVGDMGRPYFPLIFSLFMFILFGNLLGLIPFSFTYTSHLVVTAALAVFVIVGVTIVGFVKHGFHFLSFFVPKGVPAVMLPLMIPIEIVSYLSRPLSLAIRLFANMMAGHTMMKVFASFVFSLGAVTFGIGGLAPFAMNVALVGFEVLVAFLQAYVFSVLTCLYLNDALHLH